MEGGDQASSIAAKRSSDHVSRLYDLGRRNDVYGEGSPHESVLRVHRGDHSVVQVQCNLRRLQQTAHKQQYIKEPALWYILYKVSKLITYLYTCNQYENIISLSTLSLTEQGQVKMLPNMCFGSDLDTRTRVINGQLDYIDPTLLSQLLQTSPNPQAKMKNDSYSLGVLLLEMGTLQKVKFTGDVQTQVETLLILFGQRYSQKFQDLLANFVGPFEYRSTLMEVDQKLYSFQHELQEYWQLIGLDSNPKDTNSVQHQAKLGVQTDQQVIHKQNEFQLQTSGVTTQGHASSQASPPSLQPYVSGTQTTSQYIPASAQSTLEGSLKGQQTQFQGGLQNKGNLQIQTQFQAPSQEQELSLQGQSNQNGLYGQLRANQQMSHGQQSQQMGRNTGFQNQTQQNGGYSNQYLAASSPIRGNVQFQNLQQQSQMLTGRQATLSQDEVTIPKQAYMALLAQSQVSQLAGAQNYRIQQQATIQTAQRFTSAVAMPQPVRQQFIPPAPQVPPFVNRPMNINPTISYPPQQQRYPAAIPASPPPIYPVPQQRPQAPPPQAAPPPPVYQPPQSGPPPPNNFQQPALYLKDPTVAKADDKPFEYNRPRDINPELEDRYQKALNNAASALNK